MVRLMEDKQTGKTSQGDCFKRLLDLTYQPRKTDDQICPWCLPTGVSVKQTSLDSKIHWNPKQGW